MASFTLSTCQLALWTIVSLWCRQREEMEGLARSRTCRQTHLKRRRQAFHFPESDCRWLDAGTETVPSSFHSAESSSYKNRRRRRKLGDLCVLSFCLVTILGVSPLVAAKSSSTTRAVSRHKTAKKTKGKLPWRDLKTKSADQTYVTGYGSRRHAAIDSHILDSDKNQTTIPPRLFLRQDRSMQIRKQTHGDNWLTLQIGPEGPQVLDLLADDDIASTKETKTVYSATHVEAHSRFLWAIYTPVWKRLGLGGKLQACV